MNKHTKMITAVIVLAQWLSSSWIACHGQSTTMTGSNNSPVQADNIAVATADTITLTTTSDTGTVTINYDYSSSPGVSGPTSGTASPGNPATSLFSLSSAASGKMNNIIVNITPCSSGTCASTETFTVDVPQVSFGNINNVPSTGSYQRVPIYGGPNPIQGTSYVTITPALLLPTGTTIMFSISNTGGGSGDATFDSNSYHQDLTQSGNLNIRGKINSTVADNMEIDAYLDDNLDDQLITDSNLQGILLFTVSTWPTNIACTMLTGFGGAGGKVGFVVQVSSDSESGDVTDLGNCDCKEYLQLQPWPTPPFLGSLNVNGTPIPNTGGSQLFPPQPIACDELEIDGDVIDTHSIPITKVFGPGTGVVVINQQYEFEDKVLHTGLMPWQGQGQGQFTITNTVSTNLTTGVRSLTVEETGNGLNPPAFDGTILP